MGSTYRSRSFPEHGREDRRGRLSWEAVGRPCPIRLAWRGGGSTPGGNPREKKRTVLNAANKDGMDAAVAAQGLRGGRRLML
uniref:Uncharacterized protein n=1 Tax=Ralstonia solanacearum TaxID=305 RepID=A0A0S4U5B9_RALSL|nr:protein of unknown function [Ralstonia solanacearum]